MDTQAFLDYLRPLPSYKGQIVHIEDIPPRSPRYGELDKPLSAPLMRRLESTGKSSLYTHQVAAINALGRGENIMVCTPSASGKTLCYNLPVIDSVSTERGCRALYLFPTKALARDQERSLRELASSLLSPQECGTFDGDTPAPERSDIKKKARIVLTNPDMLHLGILPNHASWSRFFRRLKYVVVDEAHIYRGVFGSHVALLLRRLRRICAHYGSQPLFILCSATIANPKEHAEKLVGLPFRVIAEDSSPYGGKDFVFWNPPLIDQLLGTRRSANSEAAFLFTQLVSHHIRSLAFARTRKLTELIYLYSRDELLKSQPSLARMIKPYRAGYLPEDRRQIEKELFNGELLGAVATTALELGIDIGDLDATVLTGYPGSIASAWQQAGRSGRRGEKSLSFLIGLDNPLDQYIMRHPEFFFRKSFENALINPQNHLILMQHLLCAAWELPLEEEEELFGEAFFKAREELEEKGLLRRSSFTSPSRWYLSPGVVYPAQNLNLRSASERSYSIIDLTQGILLETVEGAVALFQIHPGAIYLHQGEAYLITSLDLQSRTAFAAPTEVTYYTQAKDITDVRILKKLKEKKTGETHAYLGEVEVTTQVIGFKKKMQFTEEVLGEEPLDLPPQRFPTVGLWFDLPQEAMKTIYEQDLDLAGGLHAAEHACISLLPLFALCDRNDIGGVSTPIHPDTGKAQIFIYDAYPGGVGIAERGFEVVEKLWQATLQTISECPCEAGCPSCVQSPKCGNNNKPLDKRAALVLLGGLLSKRRASASAS